MSLERVKIIRRSQYSAPLSTVRGLRHRVHHLLVSSYQELPEDQVDLFVALDSFEFSGEKKEMMAAAKTRWSSRKLLEEDMALLFYTFLDRLRLREKNLLDADVISIRNVDLDSFDAAYVLERVARSSAFCPDIVLLVEARDHAVRLAHGQIRYLDDYPRNIDAVEFEFERSTLLHSH